MRKEFIALGLMLCLSSAWAQEVTDSISDRELGEVVVVSQSARQRIEGNRLGAERLELDKIAQLPQLFGERDIVKSITLMPGVHSEGDGGGGYEVRGGNGSQNLILLDGMTLYNPSHLLGIFSTFNSDAINRATLYKGPIPASYGEAISSVLDVEMTAGDTERYHGSATIGLLAAKVFVEGPIVKDKLSVAVSGRRSYLDAFLKLTEDYKNTVLNFYDVTAKMRYTPSSADVVDLSVVTSTDDLAIKRLMGMKWGNLAGSLGWIHRSGDWRFTTMASLTDYRVRMWMDVIDVDQMLRQSIHNANVTEKIDYVTGDNHALQMGYRSEYMSVKSGEFVVNNTLEKEIRCGWQNAVWLNYEGRFNNHWSAETGVRFSLFDALKRHTYVDLAGSEPKFANRLHFDTEFRINVKYSINDHHNVRAGWLISVKCRAAYVDTDFDLQTRECSELHD